MVGKSKFGLLSRTRWQSKWHKLHVRKTAACLATTSVSAGIPSPVDDGNTPHRGFTIVEMLGTCLLLTVLFGMTVPMLLLVAKERRSTEQRQFALQHAANLLENAVARESELIEGELPLPDADADLKEILPGLERTLIVKQLEGGSEPRQITASIRWRNRAGDLVAPLRLSAWVHPKKEAP